MYSTLKFISIYIFVCILVTKTSSSEDHHGHEKITRSNVVEEIIEHVGATKKVNNTVVFVYKDIEKILMDLNFKNCSEEETSTRCNLCYSTNDVFSWLNHNKSKEVTEEQFLIFAEAILYLLINKPPNNISTVCKTYKTNLTSTSSTNVYQLFTNKYGQTSNGKFEGEEALEKVLEDIKIIIGDKLTSSECFSADDVISGVNVSETEFGSKDLKYASAFIILKLLDKNCIKDGDHAEHNHGILPGSTEFVTHIFSEFGLNATHMSHETFENLVKKLNLGGAATGTDEHSGHTDHRKKRSMEVQSRRYRRSAAELNKCFSGENLLEIFQIPEGSFITTNKFQEICPALIQQLESGVCSNTATNTTILAEDDTDKWKPWIGMIISIAIVSTGSLIGVVAAPFTSKKWFPFFIMFLIALAVATLIGDSIMHLLPHSLNLHKHDEGAHSAEEHSDGGNEFLKADSFLWKCVLFVVGIYVFFTFEIIMHAFGGGHSHSHDVASLNESPQNNGHVHHVGGNNSLKQNNSKKALQVVENGKVFDNVNRKESSVYHTPSGMLEFSELDCTKDDSYDNSVKPIVIAKSFISIRDFKSVVWMILIGDAVHNFMDGVAIGVAFSETWPSGLHGGISTSIAIFCHELPHELGDFAVLLASGLSIKQALLMNFISSLAAFFGGILGVSLGTQWDATPWIFAITAGLFIYIALADMFPEALHSESLKRQPWTSIVLLDLGLFIGFLLMFILAAWEEDIKSAIQ